MNNYMAEWLCNILCRRTTEYTQRIGFGSNCISDLIVPFTCHLRTKLHVHSTFTSDATTRNKIGKDAFVFLKTKNK